MDTKKLGTHLGDLVCLVWFKTKDEIGNLVRRDEDTTFFNYLLLLTWAARMAMAKKLISRRDEAAEVLDAMHVQLHSEMQRMWSTPPDGEDFIAILEDRYAGYDAALEDESSDNPLQNVGNYFLACCNTENLAFVDYDQIIPDPEQMAEFPEFVDLAKLEELRAAWDKEGLFTFPMSIQQNFAITVHVGAFSKSVQEFLEKTIGR